MPMNSRAGRAPCLALVLLILTTTACAPGGSDGQGASRGAAAGAAATLAARETAIPENPSRDAYYGETHMHTAYSLDAYIGGARLTPSDSFRFAKGETMEVNGHEHNIGRPLDFASVTDHAEYIGEMYSTINAGAPGHDQALLDELRSLTGLEEREAWFATYVVANNRGTTPQHPPFFAGPETVIGAWNVTIDAVNEHYEPGVFTTIPAFEWSGAPGGGNLHRNVLFRDMNLPEAPVSYIDINREDGLWEWLAGLEDQGMKPLAIPHNSNASKTMMFAPDDANGDPIDLEYAELRARFEPLIEIMQIKGSSEVHRTYWGADEFADFENADSLADYSDRAIDKRNFVRWAVIEGMAIEQRLGRNPYQLGFVGGTDNHNGAMSDVVEDNWNGSHGPTDGTVEMRRTGEVGGWAKARDINPGALTGVWATKNTRGAIFDAMKRRETFATSGTRIKVRLFAGTDLPRHPDNAQLLVQQGYEQGAPMGATLDALAGPPTFTFWAIKDPEGANLDRIQLIKGWVDPDGKHHEKIVEAAWSGERKQAADGLVPAVGNTVDLGTAMYTNTIGSTELIGSWTDDEYDPSRPALYYVRVLEIPTPRWSTYDAVRAGLPLLSDVPATIQERAWSSPIWIRANGGQ